MATAEEVRKLAALARIEVADDELERFTKEFDEIIAYVGQLESLELPEAADVPPLRNVMRADTDPYPAGEYTEKLAEQFPARDGDALLVKQVISHG